MSRSNEELLSMYGPRFRIAETLNEKDRSKRVKLTCGHEVTVGMSANSGRCRFCRVGGEGGAAPAPTSQLDSANIMRMVDAAVEVRAARLAAPTYHPDELIAAVKDALAKILPLKVVVQAALKSKSGIVLDNAHASLPDLLGLLGLRKHVYLWGPPGGGKSTAARMAAAGLKIAYGYISLNPQTPDSRLLGFIDAHGVYRPSVLYKLYTEGGVFCIDEMDNASASLLTTLNSLFENGKGAFPCGNVDRHPDFVVVATGNTSGHGGNEQFPDRRVFDAAFAGRFLFMHWAYDERLERTRALELGGAQAARWVDWMQSTRKWALTNDPQLVISPRETFSIAELTAKLTLPVAQVLELALFKGIKPERVRRLLVANALPEAACMKRCPKCNGCGRYVGRICPRCNGKGRR